MELIKPFTELFEFMVKHGVVAFLFAALVIIVWFLIKVLKELQARQLAQLELLKQQLVLSNTQVKDKDGQILGLFDRVEKMSTANQQALTTVTSALQSVRETVAELKGFLITR